MLCGLFVGVIGVLWLLLCSVFMWLLWCCVDYVVIVLVCVVCIDLKCMWVLKYSVGDVLVMIRLICLCLVWNNLVWVWLVCVVMC